MIHSLYTYKERCRTERGAILARKSKNKGERRKDEQQPSATDAALERLNDRQNAGKKFQSVLLFTLAVLFFLLSFIQGSSGWYVLHRFVRGVFGFSIILVPIILLIAAYYTEHRSNLSLVKRLLFGLVLTILVSSFIQVMFFGEIEKKSFGRAVVYLYETAADNPFESGGVISAVLAWPLLKLLGVTGARIVTCILLFLAIMWMLDLNMEELFAYLAKPFQKLRDMWRNRNTETEEDAENTQEIPPLGEDLEEAEEVEETPSWKTRLRKISDWFFGEEVEAEDVEYTDAYDTWAGDPGTPPVQDAPSYDFPTYTSPQQPETYDMDIDIPIHTGSKPAPEPASEPEPALESEPVPVDEEVLVTDPVQDAPEFSETPTHAPEPEEPEDDAVSEEADHVPTSSKYIIPPLTFLKGGVSRANDPAAEQELRDNANILVDTLQSFGVSVRITGISRGPSVTRYEIQPAAGVKVSKITSLSDDIALALAAQGVRIEAPVPGKPVIGVEVPNGQKDTVSLREILESDNFKNARSRLAFCVGKDIAGNAVVGDIAKLPHMIIAGATGSGKSVCTNSIIMSLLYHASPEDVKLILIDPKIVEFTVYEGIPHLLIPVVTDPKKAAGALNWAVQEMQRRYNIFAENGVRDLGDYNTLAAQKDSGLSPMPQIVIIIDELADLMMTTSKDVEDAICRLAQKARAAGMHLIIATQRPTTDIITGLIKANIPSRIALSVMSQVDSRTILDMGGAEKLLGHGDMLYLPNGHIKPMRVQGCYVSTAEIERTVAFIKKQSTASYNDDVIEQVEKNIPVTKAELREQKAEGEHAPEPGSDEEVLERAIEYVVEAGQASTSSLQRHLKLGYARAARIMDELEDMGIIGPYEGAKPRKVLMTKEQLEERKLRHLP